MDEHDARTLKEVTEILDKIKKLQQQIDHPDRQGMIAALSDAQSTAPVEIRLVEFAQGDNTPMMWECFPTSDLYRKLSQYQAGLRARGIAKIGERAFNELLKEQ